MALIVSVTELHQRLNTTSTWAHHHRSQGTSALKWEVRLVPGNKNDLIFMYSNVDICVYVYESLILLLMVSLNPISQKRPVIHVIIIKGPLHVVRVGTSRDIEQPLWHGRSPSNRDILRSTLPSIVLTFIRSGV
jgi:hypothetical protein